ncbi:MAG TPA: hypothetical protein VHL58_20715 [Thermoanaerobaculia bacterium]|nr:hypothetical protein [Thermoanaerobaculia bacterium]
MAFYIRRILETGPIRFSVAHRAARSSPDPSAELSTGPRGEYRRLGESILYFSESRDQTDPQFSRALSGNRSLWEMIRPGGGRGGYWPVVVMVFGALFILLGAASIAAHKGAPGVIEVIIGLALVATPVMTMARKRQQLRAEEEKIRKEREDEEKRVQAIVGTYAEKLQQYRERLDDESLEVLRRERPTHQIPYEIVRPMAMHALTVAGFDAISRFREIGLDGVDQKIVTAARGIGLNDEDERIVRRQLYQKLLWHQIADDRVHQTRDILEQFRSNLHVDTTEMEWDMAALEQFEKLAGVNSRTLPQIEDGTVKLRFHEVLHHKASGDQVRPEAQRVVTGTEPNSWSRLHPVSLLVTSKRLMFGGRRKDDIPFSKSFDLEVDADQGVVSVKTPDAKKSVHMLLPDAIYTASMIDLAATPGRPGQMRMDR